MYLRPVAFWLTAALSAIILFITGQQATAGNSHNILIDALYYNTYESYQPDEAVQLYNAGAQVVDIGGWQVTDNVYTVSLPPGVVLKLGQRIWLAREGAPFQRQFGFAPNFEDTDSDSLIPNLDGTWPRFSDDGDQVILKDASGAIVDVLVYGDADTNPVGWSGPAVMAYTPTNVFSAEGQILYRRRDQVTGALAPDTNTAADWAQSAGDPIDGRKVRYPGWDLDSFFFTERITETAQLTIAIAPDNAYEALRAEIDGATTSLQVVAMTFENTAIAEALVDAAIRGVAVTVLLEGTPPGGLTDQTRHICQQMESAGAACWFMINEPEQQIYDRYAYMHAKYLIVDGERVLISSENLSPDSLPYDDKLDGTWGRRGLLIITDAPTIVARVQAIFERDFDPANHVDLLHWMPSHPLYGDKYGAPPTGFVPLTESGGVSYTVRYPAPLSLTSTFAFELIQSPENSLRYADGLLGLLARAGAGDTILAQMLEERPYWGATGSNPSDDPNPRLEAYLNAARRGAHVRLLLDSFFDDPDSPTGNWATCAYVRAIAHTEQLDLACALNNPTGLGIHNKMALAEIDGQGWVHIGSLNGGELSHKGNRELALQFQSDEAYALLASMFTSDWPHGADLPVLYNHYRGPADHLLISEALYDPAGLDGAEFIEIVNPTGSPIDLAAYSLGDAVQPADFEDVRRFPPGLILGRDEMVVVALSATDFHADFGFDPDFEIDDSDPAVPNLIDDPAWGDPAAILQLGNGGDEVILRDPAGVVVDVLVYGDGNFPGVIPFTPLPPANSGRSLERFPYWRDSDDCLADFRERALPTPGRLP